MTERKAANTLLGAFPNNVYIHRLLDKASELRVSIIAGEVQGQWLYHPKQRTLCVWEPDLSEESLSFLVVILAHELGHVLDFDRRPESIEVLANTHWKQVPVEFEMRAFIYGFLLIEQLEIPVTREQYLQMIDEPLAQMVHLELDNYELPVAS